MPARRAAAHHLCRAATVALALVGPGGCAAVTSPVSPRAAVEAPVVASAPFVFARDTFAFANETLWDYVIDPAAGTTGWTRHEPAPDFFLRCGNMVRAARQLRLEARFDPSAARLDDTGYEQLLRRILDRDPRARAPASDPVVLPGYADLRSFSAAHPGAVKEALRGPWRSYLQRGNWRMIFPFSDAHQVETAGRLAEEVAAGRLPIVHALRYPQLTINHMLLVYAADVGPAEIRFHTYDPNDAQAPLVLVWERGSRQFVYPRMPYFVGGPVKVYEVYDGLLY